MYRHRNLICFVKKEMLKTINQIVIYPEYEWSVKGVCMAQPSKNVTKWKQNYPFISIFLQWKKWNDMLNGERHKFNTSLLLFWWGRYFILWQTLCYSMVTKNGSEYACILLNLADNK